LVGFVGTGGGGGGFIPSFTLFGGIDFGAFITLGGGGGGGILCAFLVLVTVTGIASSPFSTTGLGGIFFLSWA